MVQIEICTDVTLLWSSCMAPYKLHSKIIPGTS